MRKNLLTLLLFAIVLAGIAFLGRFNTEHRQGKARVIDGDSIVLDGAELRLSGIDAPELHQTCERSGRPWNCGQEARSVLVGMLVDELQCEVHGIDQYDRGLAICRVDTIEVNAAMVKMGWAVDYGGYFREEAAAHKAGAGIWSSSFERPEDWRRKRRFEGEQSEGSEAGSWRRWFQNLW